MVDRTSQMGGVGANNPWIDGSDRQFETGGAIGRSDSPTPSATGLTPMQRRGPAGQPLYEPPRGPIPSPIGADEDHFAVVAAVMQLPANYGFALEHEQAPLQLPSIGGFRHPDLEQAPTGRVYLSTMAVNVQGLPARGDQSPAVSPISSVDHAFWDESNSNGNISPIEADFGLLEPAYDRFAEPPRAVSREPGATATSDHLVDLSTLAPDFAPPAASTRPTDAAPTRQMHASSSFGPAAPTEILVQVRSNTQVAGTPVKPYELPKHTAIEERYIQKLLRANKAFPERIAYIKQATELHAEQKGLTCPLDMIRPAGQNFTSTAAGSKLKRDSRLINRLMGSSAPTSDEGNRFEDMALPAHYNRR